MTGRQSKISGLERPLLSFEKENLMIESFHFKLLNIITIFHRVSSVSVFCFIKLFLPKKRRLFQRPQAKMSYKDGCDDYY